VTVAAAVRGSVPAAGAVAELVRLPAVLSVPGDVLLGAAAAGRLGDLRRARGLVAGSCCLYLAGMALNDYADRDVDARERPLRPIPSGRVSPGFALALASGLTLAGASAAVAADGAVALALAGPLVIAIWGYDVVLKSTPAGPAAMSACRMLDVLVGAGLTGVRAALPAAALVGAHTAAVTALSRHEAWGEAETSAGQARDGGRRAARRAAAATAAIAVAASAASLGGARSPGARALALGLVGAYAGGLGRGLAGAIAKPSPQRLQRAVGAGVLGLMPLEGGLLAGAGALAPAAVVASLWPLAGRLARRRSVT
jgi:UbiA prenyltransferase family